MELSTPPISPEKKEKEERINNSEMTSELKLEYRTFFYPDGHEEQGSIAKVEYYKEGTLFLTKEFIRDDEGVSYQWTLNQNKDE